MTLYSQLYSPLNGLTAIPVDFTMGVPVAASLEIKNGSTSTLTLTSIKGEDIGNATTVTATSSTNAAAVAITGYDIVIGLHVDGTNGIDTKVSDVKTLLEANTNITAIVTAATTKDGVMAASTKASLAGGDDKLVDADAGKVCTLVRDLKGSYTLTLNDQFDAYHHVATMGTVSGTAGSSGVGKVECTRTDADTFVIRMTDYAAAATDVTAASQLKLAILVSK